MKILIIEDDMELAGAMADYLELQGCDCDFAYSGASGVELAQVNHFDIIILDLMIPKLNGFNVCKYLRKFGILTPVLMLTSSDTEHDQLKGFQSGVDDYVIKPSTMPVIWARIQALTKRKQGDHNHLEIGELKIFFKQHKVERQNQEIKLTPTEWQILSLLAKRFPNVVKRSEIEESVWRDSKIDQGKFNVHLHGLRKAVDKPFDFAMIETIVNVGLKLAKKKVN